MKLKIQGSSGAPWDLLFRRPCIYHCNSGLSSLGVPGVPWHTQIFSDQLTLCYPGGTDYAHLITTGTPGFSDLPTALLLNPMSPSSLNNSHVRKRAVV